jgi:tetratricopeptide (TPR) repeat protein
VFKVQADIAGKVASALDVALADSARRAVAAAPTANLSAYDAFLKGEAASQEMSATDPPSLRRAIPFYEQAVSLDSGFVRAWAQLARAKAFLYFNSVPTPELANEVHDAAERAEALAPGRAEGALALGLYYASVANDLPRTLATLEAGLRQAPNDAELLSNLALVEQNLGKWESAMQHFARARALDPRSAATARRLGNALLVLRRYPEARAVLDSSLALAPTNLVIIENRAMVALAQGDLAGARAVAREYGAAVPPTQLLAYFSQYQDLYWIFDDAQQRQLLTLPPSFFDGDRGTWALVLAQTHALRGNQMLSRIYADSARLAFEDQLRAAPEDGQRHVLLGLALAYLGRNADAIREGERGVQLFPISRAAFLGAYVQHQLARIYALAGQSDKAIDVLESLLKIPYYLSPGWLKIDPEFAMLKGNARFDRLVGQ